MLETTALLILRNFATQGNCAEGISKTIFPMQQDFRKKVIFIPETIRFTLWGRRLTPKTESGTPRPSWESRS